MTRSRRLGRSTAAALAAVATIAASLLLPVATAGPAAAAEVYPVPATGSYPVQGHGFGHGRGMSQWGTYGMATQGKTAADILNFYYPGSAPGAVANQTLRVWLTKGSGTDLTVLAAGTQWLVDKGHASQQVPLPSSVSGQAVAKWKVAKSGTGMALSGWWANAWHPYPETSPLVTPGPVSFATSAASQRVVYSDGTQREYEGTLDAVLDAGLLRAINAVPLESYLDDVVPHEEPSSWPAAALQAQAIAARTYAAASMGGAVYDICDSSTCQVYDGIAGYDTGGNRTAYQAAATNSAVAATAGQIRTYGGRPISAQYSSSDGGWTVDAGVPYKPAQPDPWDVYSPYHDWTTALSASAIQAAYPAIGTLRDITIGARDGNGDWGGRVLSLTLAGAAGSQTVSGESFRAALGLRSSWFTLGATPPAAEAGLLHPLSPARILDTRTTASPLRPGETRTVRVAGLGGVPAGALGAVLNVTATDTTGTSYLTVWPTPGARPNTSNLNWDRAGQTVANLVFTGLGPDGNVQVYNNQATASVVVDVFGYFAAADTPGGLAFVPLSPQRVLDTRFGIGGPVAPIGPGGTRTLALAGATGGVSGQAQAVVANLTETRPTAESYLTMWPAGAPMPTTSNINMLPRDTRANAALGVLGTGTGSGQGGVSLYNNLGSSDAILDVLGEYLPAVGSSGSYVGIQPSRLLDTRTTLGGHAGPMKPGETFALSVLGRGGVPAAGVSAVVLNVTAVAPTAPTYVTVWASGGGSRPGISNLNAGSGAVVPNLVVAGIGSDGKVNLYNDQGSTHLVVDVVGWISG